MLYILREGVLACASMMEHGGHGDQAESMIAYVQKCPVSNIISPWINACRSKKNIEVSQTNNLVLESGDIVCNNAVFLKKHYQHLIPKIASSLHELYHDAFEGDGWLQLMLGGTMHVSVMNDAKALLHYAHLKLKYV